MAQHTNFPFLLGILILFFLSFSSLVVSQPVLEVLPINPARVVLNWEVFGNSSSYTIYNHDEYYAVVSRGNQLTNDRAFFTTTVRPNTDYFFRVASGNDTSDPQYYYQMETLNSSVPMVTYLDATHVQLAWLPFSSDGEVAVQALVGGEWIYLSVLRPDSPNTALVVGSVRLTEGDQFYCRLMQGGQITESFLLFARPLTDLSSFEAYETVTLLPTSYDVVGGVQSPDLVINGTQSLSLHFDQDPNGIPEQCTLASAYLRVTLAAGSSPGGGFVRVYHDVNANGTAVYPGAFVSNDYAQLQPYPYQNKFDVSLDRVLSPSLSLEESLRSWKLSGGDLLVQLDGGSRDKVVIANPLTDVQLVAHYTKRLPQLFSDIITFDNFTSPLCPTMTCVNSTTWHTKIVTFVDPLPADALLLQVRVLVSGSWEAHGRLSVTLDNGAVGSVALSQSALPCVPTASAALRSPMYRVDAGGFPGYQKGQENTMFFLVEGNESFCVEDISMEMIYVQSELLPCMPSPSVTPTPSISRSSSASPSRSVSISRSPSVSPSRSASPTPSLSMGASPSRTPSNSPSSSQTPSSSASVSETSSVTLTPTSSSSTSISVSPSATRSSSRSLSSTRTGTRTPSRTPTASPTSSASTSRSSSRSVTPSTSVSLSRTASPSSSVPRSVSPSSTLSATSTATATATATRTGTSTATSTATATGTATATATSTPSPTSTATVTAVPSSSHSASSSVSVSRLPSPSASGSITRTPSRTPTPLVLPPVPSNTPSPSRNPSTSFSSSPAPSLAPSSSPTPTPSASAAAVVTSGSSPVVITDDKDEPVVIVSPTGVSSDDTLEVQPLNRDEVPTPNRLTSSVVSLILRNADGEEIQPEDKVEICLAADDLTTGEQACLGFLDETAVGGARWRCQDRCLRRKQNLFCGDTDHFTNFALLLNGGASECGSGHAFIFRESWKDGVLLGSFGGAAIVCIICIVLLSFTPAGSRFIRGSEGDRIARLRTRERTVVQVEQHV